MIGHCFRLTAIRCLLLYISFLPVLFVNTDAQAAADVFGKVVTSSAYSRNPVTYPLISGKSILYDGNSLIKFDAGTILLDSSSRLSAFDLPSNTVFKLSGGSLGFRLNPENRPVIFKVPQGRILVAANNGANSRATTGRITIRPNHSTVLEVEHGEVVAQTDSGETLVSGGQAVVIAQANLSPEGASNPPPPVERTQPRSVLSTPREPVSPARARRYETGLPPALSALLDLIGLSAETPTGLAPRGELVVNEYVEWDGEGELVDYNLETLPADLLAKGTIVKVICIRTKDQVALVRPLDSLYPEKPQEINLVGNYVYIVGEDEPEVEVMLDRDSNMAWKNGIELRSWGPWTALLVDDELQPISDLYASSEQEAEGKESEEPKKYTIACVRSSFLVQRVSDADPDNLEQIGRTVVSTTPLSPAGKVRVRSTGRVWSAAVVDYNLKPIDEGSYPAGVEFKVVAVDGMRQRLLVQLPEHVLEENKYIGRIIVTETHLDPFGNVLLHDDRWIGVAVNDGLDPIYPQSREGTRQVRGAGGGGNSPQGSVVFPAGVEVVVVGVVTTLLIQPSGIILAPFIPVAGAPPFITVTQAAVGAAALGAVAVPIALCIGNVICDENDEPASPLIPMP